MDPTHLHTFPTDEDAKPIWHIAVKSVSSGRIMCGNGTGDIQNDPSTVKTINGAVAEEITDFCRQFSKGFGPDAATSLLAELATFMTPTTSSIVVPASVSTLNVKGSFLAKNIAGAIVGKYSYIFNYDDKSHPFSVDLGGKSIAGP